MLIVMDRSTHEEHLSQPLETKNKQFKIAVFFLAAYIGSFNVTNSNDEFYFKKTITDADDFIQTTISPGVHEIKSLHIEFRRIITEKGHYTEDQYPFITKPNFSTQGSILEISPQGSIISFLFNDSIRNLLGLNETILYRQFISSLKLVDIISSDNIFTETDIAERMIFKGKRSGITMKFTMQV